MTGECLSDRLADAAVWSSQCHLVLVCNLCLLGASTQGSLLLPSHSLHQQHSHWLDMPKVMGTWSMFIKQLLKYDNKCNRCWPHNNQTGHLLHSAEQQNNLQKVLVILLHITPITTSVKHYQTCCVISLSAVLL